MYISENQSMAKYRIYCALCSNRRKKNRDGHRKRENDKEININTYKSIIGR